MATIDSLRRQPDIQDFSATSQFMVTLSNFPLSEWFCTAVTVPGITLGTVDRSSPLKMIPSVGDTLTYDNLDMTMMVDEELKNYQEIHDWMVNIGFPYSPQLPAGSWDESVNENEHMRTPSPHPPRRSCAKT